MENSISKPDNSVLTHYEEKPRTSGKWTTPQAGAYGGPVANEDNETLTTRAANGDQVAWNAIVDRFESLVWSITYEFRLPQATREDVFQLTWLRLLDNIDRIREPERLAGWIATTARRECLAVIRSSSRLVLADNVEAAPVTEAIDSALLADERLAAVAHALGELGEKCQQLIRLLASDPPIDYVSISEIMDLAVGSIGPTRKRCLDRLRSRPSVARIIGQEGYGEQDQL